MVAKFKEKIEELVNSDEVYIESVEYVKEQGVNILRVTLNSNVNEVDLNLCVDVTRIINDYLNDNDFTDDEYMLEVSSAGVTDDEIEHELNIYDMVNQYIYVKTYAKIDGKKEFIGILKSIDEENLVISINEQDITLHVSKIAIIKEYPNKEEN